MKFKDVARLYLGCKLNTPEGIATFDEYNRASEQPVTTYDTVVAYFTFEQIKPILRPLSSLTDDERKHIDSIVKECNTTDYELLRKLIVYNDAVVTNYLTSRYIDVFMLIDSGEAIDATTLTPNPYHEGTT